MWIYNQKFVRIILKSVKYSMLVNMDQNGTQNMPCGKKPSSDGPKYQPKICQAASNCIKDIIDLPSDSGRS